MFFKIILVLKIFFKNIIFYKNYINKLLLIVFIIFYKQFLYAFDKNLHSYNKLFILNSIKVNFKQVCITDNKNIYSIYGTLIYKKPGYFICNIKKPEKKFILLDGKYIWIYNLIRNRVFVIKKENQIIYKKIPILSLINLNNKKYIRKYFNVYKENNMKNKTFYILYNKYNNNDSCKIRILFVNKKIDKIEIYKEKYKVIIRLYNIRKNIKLSKYLFRFYIRKPVTIISHNV